MRNEQEMYGMILQVAKEDDRILAVYMNGSRTNDNVPRDIFQDYDVVYVVNDTLPFIADKSWINQFGERMFMQYPDENPYYTNDKESSYGWLMQFADGIRMDLTVETLTHAREHMTDDRLCRVLLDKDDYLPRIGEPTDVDYWVKRPTMEQYLATCNEFWWCLDNVAKGLWRGEIPYVQDMLNFIIRKQLEKVLSWKVGVITQFTVSVGKSGKFMNKWLEPREWQDYLATYAPGEVDAIWIAVEKMCKLFTDTAMWVGDELGFTYNREEGNNCRAYLEHVKKLPKDAKSVY